MAKTDDSNGIADKAAAAAERVEAFRQELLQHRRLTQQAQAREALNRVALTEALTAALLGREEALACARTQALRGYLATRRRKRPRTPSAESARLERLLLKLGSIGEAVLITRAGVWQGKRGRAWRNILDVASYVRRGPDPTAAPLAVFDQAWYLAAYPDAGASKRSPLGHYLTVGAKAGYAPHPLFDLAHYNAAPGVSHLEDFVRSGAADGRSVHPLFDLAHYLAQGPDLAPGEDAALHYLQTGWKAGLSPHPLFDPAWYSAQAEGADGMPPLLHYLWEGWRRGLSPHPLFDTAWYLQANPDVAAQGAEPLAHFLSGGGEEGRDPSPWFSLEAYRAVRDTPPGINPLLDYIQGGAWLVSEAKPGLPTAAYLADDPASARKGMTPLEHWARRNLGRL